MRTMSGIAAALLLLIAPLSSQAGGHEESPGSCTYILENMFAGPFKVCEEPVDAAGCAELGTQDDNREAVHSPAGCSMDDVVGICVKPDGRSVHYEGEPAMLEIGCAFAGGDWEDA